MEKENIIAIKERSTDKANAAFHDFMHLTETEFNNRAKQSPGLYKNCNGSLLEQAAVTVLQDVAPATPFRPENICLVSGSRFPDIVAEHYYGVEVKTTEKDHWISTGSSIVESSRIEDIELIYMLFGKLGGQYAEFKCRPYEDVLSEIAVTHSPRYLIDMTLTKGQSIFDKMGTTYNQLRTSPDNIEQVRHYYRKKAKEEGKEEMPWWLSESETTAVNLRLWQSKDPQIRHQNELLTAKMVILFPEILESDFKEIAMWLCSRYSVVSYNLRDIFTAGGKCDKVNGKSLKNRVPHIYINIINNARLIKHFLYNPLLIQQELKEFRLDLYNTNTKDLYHRWLEDFNTRVQNNKEIRKIGGIPFIKWFESEATLTCPKQ